MTGSEQAFRPEGDDGQPVSAWMTWIPFHVMVCTKCSALVMDETDSIATHELWHIRQTEGE